MTTPNDGDIDYLQVIAQKIGDQTTEFQLFRHQLYYLFGTMKLKNGAGDFMFYRVANEAALPTGGSAPTKPSFGYTDDAGIYWVYNLVDSEWQKVGLILP
jgi:hypothetical protein